MNCLSRRQKRANRLCPLLVELSMDDQDKIIFIGIVAFLTLLLLGLSA
jgi:hypothetical protein